VSRKKRRTESKADMDMAVAGTAEAETTMDAAVASTEEAGAVLDASVAETVAAKASLDASVAEAASGAAGALNETFPVSTDWTAVEVALKAAMPDLTVTVENETVKVTGVPADQTKDTAARVWRVVGDMRRSGALSALPKVEVVS